MNYQYELFQKPKLIKPSDKVNRHCLNIGSAGVHYVCRELLVLGVNASIAAEGLASDIYAEWEDIDGQTKIAGLQVKTKKELKATNSFNFHKGFHGSVAGVRPYEENEFDIAVCVCLDANAVVFTYGVPKGPLTWKRSQLTNSNVAADTWNVAKDKYEKSLERSHLHVCE